MLGSGTWRSKVHPQIRENIYKTPCCGCWHPLSVVAGLRISIELIVIHWGVHVPSLDVCNPYQLRILSIDLTLPALPVTALAFRLQDSSLTI